ncbi:hypothetical protein [Lysobacter sp. CA199]|uniref:hypothetical protein n=1 Tax=Lysobacter sp. CA199 TaxID=3455608 RepID=UPI003F8D77A8
MFAGIEDGVLLIEDVFADAAFDLPAAIARLIDRPVHGVRLAFTPERWWPRARAVELEDDAGLFVRNLTISAQPSRFPLLART